MNEGPRPIRQAAAAVAAAEVELKHEVLSPLMELPPLSPGIQARVMEEVEVVETVRRGWSGGTATDKSG